VCECGGRWIEDKVCSMHVCMYVCLYVSGTGAEKVTKQTREKDGNAVFESIIRDIE